MLKKFRTDFSSIDGSEAASEEFDAPTEDMHSILPLFYQSGYITIKDYDSDFSVFTLGFPNKEVRTGMMKALYPYYVNPDTDGRANVLRSITKGFMKHDLDMAFDTLRPIWRASPIRTAVSTRTTGRRCSMSSSRC